MDADRKPSAWTPRRALVAALVLVVLAVAYLAVSAGPPPMDGHGRQLFGLWRTRHVVVALALAWGSIALVVWSFGPRARARFVALNVSFAGFWLLLEAVGLAGVVSYPKLLGGVAHEQLGTRPQPNVDVQGVAREDLATSWNLPREPIPFHFQTDHRGFRNAEDRDAADIYCLGDSFLVAGLVAQDAIVPAVLERDLRRPTMGVALVGLSPQAEAQLLLDTQVPFEGRLVLHFVFEGNDLLDSAAWRSGKKGEAPSWKERTLANQLVVRAQLLTQPQPAYVERRTGWIGDEAYRFGWLKNSFEGLEGELQPIADKLALLAGRVRSAGGEYAVVIVPDKLRVLGPSCRFPADSEVADWKSHCGPIPEFLARWSATSGIPVLDLTEPLRAATRADDVPWFPADTHWNATGHRVAAQAIAAWEPVQRFAQKAR
ncbi:MAG: hypothetical protein IPJ77_05665 [Planctomycetes bacterium]|nr:hypothetical protein [Planctomycetota bacterium]